METDRDQPLINAAIGALVVFLLCGLVYLWVKMPGDLSKELEQARGEIAVSRDVALAVARSEINNLVSRGNLELNSTRNRLLEQEMSPVREHEKLQARNVARAAVAPFSLAANLSEDIPRYGNLQEIVLGYHAQLRRALSADGLQAIDQRLRPKFADPIWLEQEANEWRATVAQMFRSFGVGDSLRSHLRYATILAKHPPSADVLDKADDAQRLCDEDMTSACMTQEGREAFGKSIDETYGTAAGEREDILYALRWLHRRAIDAEIYGHDTDRVVKAWLEQGVLFHGALAGK